MTNRNKIDEMSNEELAIILGHKNNNCMYCSYDANDCFGKDCVDGIKKWLDAPSNKASRKRVAVKSENPPAENNPPTDNVNHLAYCTFGNIETIDFIEDKKLDFHMGNAVKYISRAGRKDPAKTIEDLRKATWHLNRQIIRLEYELGGQNN